MSGDSKIEWTDATWNPVVGCSIVSPGCTNCYAMKMAARLEAMGQPIYAGMTKRVNGNAVWTGKVEQSNWGQVIKPLSWKKPRRIFVNSMSDLFHENLPDETIDEVFAVMALCPQHTFQVLTKRAERMREYLSKCPQAIWHRIALAMRPHALKDLTAQTWPLPNVHLGVSCERQQEADERIPLLLQTPAAVRFISAEPLLGAIDLTKIDLHRIPGQDKWTDALRGTTTIRDVIRQGGWGGVAPSKLDWVIVGGESGSNARPMHLDWARSLRDQCKAAGVAFFFKQWGEYHPSADHDPKTCPVGNRTPDAIHLSGKREFMPSEQFRLIGGRIPGWAGMCRVGKKAAGRLLDGVEHNAMPGASE